MKHQYHPITLDLNENTHSERMAHLTMAEALDALLSVSPEADFAGLAKAIKDKDF